MAAAKTSRVGNTIPIVVLFAAAVLVLLGSMLITVPEPRKVEGLKPSKGTIGVLRLDSETADQLLTKQAQLKDPGPLFLPTKWNSAFRVDAERNIRKPGENFRGYGPKYVFVGSATPVSLPPPVEAPSNPAAELDHLRADRPFPALGLRNDAAVVFGRVHLSLELSEPGSGNRVVSLEVGDGRWPSPRPWQPAEFLVLCSPAGLVGKPGLVVSSGLEVVDLHLEGLIQDNWVKVARAGRLSSGVYRILIGE